MIPISEGEGGYLCVLMCSNNAQSLGTVVLPKTIVISVGKTCGIRKCYCSYWVSRTMLQVSVVQSKYWLQ